MNKKNILCTIVLLLLFIIISYSKPIQVNDLIVPYTSETLPKKIDSSIYFSSYSSKELKVTGEESIKEIVMLLENMKVRKKLNFPNPYRPKIKDGDILFIEDSLKDSATVERSFSFLKVWSFRQDFRNNPW